MRARTRRREQGAVAVVFALALPVLLGLAALAIDVARALVIRSELQSAADACALAAVAQLRTGSTDAARLVRAEAHGLAMGDPLAVSVSGSARPSGSTNRFDFQSRELNASRIHVSFAAGPTGPWLSAADSGTGNAVAAATHARCVAEAGQVPLLLAGGASRQWPVSAYAIAGLVSSQVNCAFPLSVCKAPGSGANTNPPFGLPVGDWLREPASSGSKRYGSSGNFGWVDFSPPAGGADELSRQIAGQGSCSLQTGAQVGESGAKSSVYDAWNARFGLYRSGGPSPAASPGDFSGFAYTDTTWPPKKNAYSGTAGSGASARPNFRSSRASFTPYQGNAASGVNVNHSSNWSSAERRAQGRDRRLVVTPVVDCSVWNASGSAQPVIEAWACSLLLAPIATTGNSGPGAIEYLGLANAPGSPCASSGLPGSSASAGPLVPVLVE